MRKSLWMEEEFAQVEGVRREVTELCGRASQESEFVNKFLEGFALKT